MAVGGRPAGKEEERREDYLDSDQSGIVVRPRAERVPSKVGRLSSLASPCPPRSHPNNWQVQTSSLCHLHRPHLSSKRALILDYLVQRCYTRTARAFAADSTIRHLNADGDEIRCPRGEDDFSGITEDALQQADRRRGAYSYPAYTHRLILRT